MDKAIIYCDGGARGNPGPAAAGFVIIGERGKPTYAEASAGRELAAKGVFLGENLTNNQAEYQSLILALEEAMKLKIKSLKVFSDSELLVKQLNGLYKVKDKGLKILFEKVKVLLFDFTTVRLAHIPRSQNKRADALVNQALDRTAKD